jgi:flagellar hook-associated protein 3 FlgL
MRASGPTQLSFASAARQSNARLQTDLLRAQKELATGRQFDSILILGANTRRNISWRNEIVSLEQQIDMGRLAIGKADITQDALAQIESIGNTFVSAMISARSANNGQQTARDAAVSAYAGIENALKSSFNGQFVFSGTNSNATPLKPYSGGSAQLAVDTAFQAAFGLSPSDSGSQLITSSDLQNFVRNAFRQEFDTLNWQANWSNASGQPILARLQNNRMIDATVNANSAGIRSIIESVISVLHMAQGNLNKTAFETLATEAVTRTASGVQGVVSERTRLGLAQQDITSSAQRMRTKSDLLKAHVQQTEGVDNYEAATRVNQLMTQLETSYAVTSKIMRLSLVNFI